MKLFDPPPAGQGRGLHRALAEDGRDQAAATPCSRSRRSPRSSGERGAYRFLARLDPAAWCGHALPDGALDYVNERVLAYFDRSFEEVIGGGWSEFVHERRPTRDDRALDGGLADGRPVRGRVRVRRASDGAYRWHLARAVASERRGENVGWVGTAPTSRSAGWPRSGRLPRRSRLGARQLARLRADAGGRRAARGAAGRGLVCGRHLRGREAAAARPRARRPDQARARPRARGADADASEAAGATAIARASRCS